MDPIIIYRSTQRDFPLKKKDVVVSPQHPVEFLLKFMCKTHYNVVFCAGYVKVDDMFL